MKWSRQASRASKLCIAPPCQPSRVPFAAAFRAEAARAASRPLIVPQARCGDRREHAHSPSSGEDMARGRSAPHLQERRQKRLGLRPPARLARRTGIEGSPSSRASGIAPGSRSTPVSPSGAATGAAPPFSRRAAQPSRPSAAAPRPAAAPRSSDPRVPRPGRDRAVAGVAPGIAGFLVAHDLGMPNRAHSSARTSTAGPPARPAARPAPRGRPATLEALRHEPVLPRRGIGCAQASGSTMKSGRTRQAPRCGQRQRRVVLHPQVALEPKENTVAHGAGDNRVRAEVKTPLSCPPIPPCRPVCPAA
jgi:hypothetical protein